MKSTLQLNHDFHQATAMTRPAVEVHDGSLNGLTEERTTQATAVVQATVPYRRLVAQCLRRLR